MFSNLTAVWISRNFEDKIINQHLPCYSPPLTSLFVMSFLVCRGNYCAWSNRFYYTNIGFLYICPPTAFFVLFVINVMALVSGRDNTTTDWIEIFVMLQCIVSSSVPLYIRSLSDFLQAMLIFPKFLFSCLDRSSANSCITTMMNMTFRHYRFIVGFEVSKNTFRIHF